MVKEMQPKSMVVQLMRVVMPPRMLSKFKLQIK